MNRYLFASLTAALLTTHASAAAPPEKTLEESAGVLDALAAIPLKGIPPKLLADAQGVVIVPRVVKVGFVVGVRGGHGVVLTRDKDGQWSDPVFVHFGGASVGFQAGVESTDVVLVFRTRKSLDRVLKGKDKFTLGADASVAAGPVGRESLAGTDARLDAEVLSYSRSRGLFVGVSLDGAVINPDPHDTAEFQKNATAEEKKWAAHLKAQLMQMSGTKPTVEVIPPPPPVLGPPAQPTTRKRPRFRFFRRN